MLQRRRRIGSEREASRQWWRAGRRGEELRGNAAAAKTGYLTKLEWIKKLSSAMLVEHKGPPKEVNVTSHFKRLLHTVSIRTIRSMAQTGIGSCTKRHAQTWAQVGTNRLARLEWTS